MVGARTESTWRSRKLMMNASETIASSAQRIRKYTGSDDCGNAVAYHISVWRLKIAQRFARIGIIGVELERLFEFRGGFRGFTQLAVQQSQAAVRRREPRRQHDGFLIFGQCRAIIAQMHFQ